MRILIVEPGPAFSVQDVASGWHSGLAHAGHDVRSFNLGERLTYHGTWLEHTHQFDHLSALDFGRLAAQMASEGILAECMTWWPDVVLIVSSFFVPAPVLRVLRGRGMTVVMHLTESPYEDDNQIGMAAHADLVLINDPTNLEKFRQVNPNTHYQPHGWNPDVHYRREPNPDASSDFVFVGSGYPSRIAFLEQCDFGGIDVALAGNWSELSPESPLNKYLAHDIDRCCDNDEAAILYSNAKTSLNLYRVESLGENCDGWSMGPRELELAAMGRFFFRQSRPESDEVLHMLPTISSPEDFSDQLRWWLGNPTARWRQAKAAQAAVADRSYYHHADRLIGLLGNPPT